MFFTIVTLIFFVWSGIGARTPSSNLSRKRRHLSHAVSHPHSDFYCILCDVAVQCTVASWEKVTARKATNDVWKKGGGGGRIECVCLHAQLTQTRIVSTSPRTPIKSERSLFRKGMRVKLLAVWTFLSDFFIVMLWSHWYCRREKVRKQDNWIWRKREAHIFSSFYVSIRYTIT